jgi:DNA-binding IscR family transcriptional regulator
MTHELWAGLNSHIFGYLRSVTLAELVRQQGPRPAGVAVLRDQRPRADADRLPEPAPNA